MLNFFFVKSVIILKNICIFPSQPELESSIIEHYATFDMYVYKTHEKKQHHIVITSENVVVDAFP